MSRSDPHGDVPPDLPFDLLARWRALTPDDLPLAPAQLAARIAAGHRAIATCRDVLVRLDLINARLHDERRYAAWTN